MLVGMRRSCLLLLAVPFVAPLSSSALRAEILDEGSFIVRQSQQPVGAEIFTLEKRSDSLVLTSSAHYSGTSQGKTVEAKKSVDVVLTAFDYAILSYQSSYDSGNQLDQRSVSVFDTTITVYRDSNERGEGTAYALPPGRFFILDSGAFALFGILVRNLSHTSFQQRPVAILVLGPTDTLLDARISRVGKETLRWGARPLVADHFRLTDQISAFDIWVHPDGRMIRLEAPTQGLRVERQPPAMKPARRRAD